jgi:hypothetical protein
MRHFFMESNLWYFPMIAYLAMVCKCRVAYWLWFKVYDNIFGYGIFKKVPKLALGVWKQW